MQEYLDAVDKEIEWCKANMAQRVLIRTLSLKVLSRQSFSFVRLARLRVL